MAPRVYDRPPFPRLEWDDVCWRAEVVCPEWAGFQTRLGPYNAVSRAGSSDGTVRLRVTVPGDDPVPPTAEQAAAYCYLVEHGTAVRDAVLAAVFAAYPQFREDYLDCFDEEDDDFPGIAAAVPVLARQDELRSVIGLGNVFVLSDAAGGVARVGFEFGCEWDGEHGLGVLTHGGRVLDIGQAPTAFGG